MSVRIAIVEDEPDIAEVLAYNLQKEGFESSTLRRGDAAFEALKEDPPDLVLLDLMLPGLDGLALVKHAAKLHGGNVEVESQLGIGSTFRVTLPLEAG